MFICYSEELKLFFKKILYFFLPIIIIIEVFEFLALYSGELLQLDSIVKIQTSSAENILYGRRLISDELRYYKYKMILEKNPEILVIGSSRANQVREEILEGAGSFYNASNLISGLENLLRLTDALPKDKTPKIIILTVDIFWFWADISPAEKPSRLVSNSEFIAEKEEAFNLSAHRYLFKYFVGEAFKFSPIFADILRQRDPLSGDKSFGLQALNSNGSRSDGSYQYGKFITAMRKELKYIDREDPSVFQTVLEGQPPFQFDAPFNDKSLDLLEDFFNFCKTRDIQVIGLAPPFSSEVYKILSASSHYQDLFNGFTEKVPLIFKENNFAYFDFSDLSQLGLNDLYMFDGMHPTETAMAEIFIRILETPEVRAILPNSNAVSFELENIIKNPNTTSFELAFE